MEESNKSRRGFLSQTLFVAARTALGTGVADATPTQQRQGIIDPEDRGTAGACILIRGADGGLYFIPGDKLGPYRLPTDKAEAARKVIDVSGTCKVVPAAAIRRAGLAAYAGMGMYVNLGAMGQRKR